MSDLTPDCPVIDGDGHLVEPADLWSTRMDRDRWGDLVPHYDPAQEAFLFGGVARIGGKAVDLFLAETGLSREEMQRLERQTEEIYAYAGGSDPEARLRDMDQAGFDAAVLYPTLALFWGPLDEIPALRDPQFVLACQQAYNDWVSEYCAASPGRLFGTAAVPLQDVDLAVAEAQRAVGNGHRAVFIRPSAYVDDLPLSHPVYDRFWAACQEMGVPVALHPGVHVDTPGACRTFGLVRATESMTLSNMGFDGVHGGSGLGQAVGNTIDMILSMGRLIMGGVCERFPDLRFIFLEAGGGWCPTQLERMDEQVEAFPMEGRWLRLRPSEYFKRQCYISFDPGEWNLAACAEFLGADRVLWASDYPHPEYDPAARQVLSQAIAGLSEGDQRRILGANAVEAYGLPQPVSAR